MLAFTINLSKADQLRCEKVLQIWESQSVIQHTILSIPLASKSELHDYQGADLIFLSAETIPALADALPVDLKEALHTRFLVAVFRKFESYPHKETLLQCNIDAMLYSPLDAGDLHLVLKQFQRYQRLHPQWPLFRIKTEDSTPFMRSLEPEHQDVEQNLLRSFKRVHYARDYLREINDSLGVVVIIARIPDQKIEYVNRHIQTVLGYDPEECINQSTRMLFSCDEIFRSANRIIEDATRKKMERIYFESEFRTKHGKKIIVEDTVSLVYEEDRLVKQICVVQDITEKRRLSLERDRLVTAIEQAGEAIVITDHEGTIQYVNPSFSRITGYSREEVLGKNPRILKSGLQDEKFYQNLWQTILSGQTWKGNFTNRRKDSSMYEQDATISPIYNERRQLINFVAVMQDVSAETELRAQLRQSQKLEAIGTLAGGIAHDFNNLLYIILGFSNLILETPGLDQITLRHTLEIRKAGERGADLVRQILSFSRKDQDSLKRPMRLQPLLQEVARLLRGSFGASVKIHQYIDADCGPILGNANQLYQVLINLGNNALQALPSGTGIVKISMQQETLQGSRLLQGQGSISGPHLVISFEDNGAGIPPEKLGRIFEPYFTTKKSKDGTGLGLSIVHKIISDHKGLITVASKPGQTIFTIYLPVYQEPQAVKEAAPLPASVVTTGQRILFVDDESQITDLVQRMLGKRNFQVQTFNSPLLAWEKFQRDPDSFDILITDQSMPEMTGTELIARMHHLRPDLPVLICTGYGEEQRITRLLPQHLSRVLQKPINFTELVDMIRQLTR